MIIVIFHESAEVSHLWNGSDHLSFLLTEQLNIMHLQHAGFINIANAGLLREGHNLGFSNLF